MSDFLKKYHTYIVALVAFLTVLAQALGYNIPTFVYDLEAAVGLGSIRITTTQVTGTTGWKTYVVSLGLAVLGGLRAYGIVIPVEVDGMVLALGGATMTNAIKKA